MIIYDNLWTSDTFLYLFLLGFLCFKNRTGFLRHHLPDNEIILAAMPLSAELRRASSTEGKAMRFAIHPQFEALRRCGWFGGAVPGGKNVGLCCFFKGFAGWDYSGLLNESLGMYCCQLFHVWICLVFLFGVVCLPVHTARAPADSPSCTYNYSICFWHPSTTKMGEIPPIAMSILDCLI